MIYPSKLSSGDKVAIVAPAGRIGDNDLEGAIKMLESWNLQVSMGTHVFDKHFFFSSSEAGRLSDFQKALDDTEVRAIFCARGGYGTGKIIDNLDFAVFGNSPKWIIGFSDITLLHMKLHGMGYASLHGPVARQLGSDLENESIDTLRKFIFGDYNLEYQLPHHQLNIEGSVSSSIIGGNLTLLCNNISTSSSINFDNKILFIEEIGERLYAIDRYMNQLDRSESLKNLRGMIVGQFTDIKNTEPAYEKTAYEIIAEYAYKYGYPVCFGLESGHEKKNLPIPISFQCDLNVNPANATVRFYQV